DVIGCDACLEFVATALEREGIDRLYAAFMPFGVGIEWTSKSRNTRNIYLWSLIVTGPGQCSTGAHLKTKFVNGCGKHGENVRTGQLMIFGVGASTGTDVIEFFRVERVLAQTRICK